MIAIAPAVHDRLHGPGRPPRRWAHCGGGDARRAAAAQRPLCRHQSGGLLPRDIAPIERALCVSDYLGHIADAARRIETYTRGMTREEFLASSLVQDAVIRNLEVIGEAARNIELADPALPAEHPQVAWSAMQGMPTVSRTGTTGTRCAQLLAQAEALRGQRAGWAFPSTY